MAVVDTATGADQPDGRREQQTARFVFPAKLLTGHLKVPFFSDMENDHFPMMTIKLGQFGSQAI